MNPLPGPKARSNLIFAFRRIRNPLEFFTRMARLYGDLVELKAKAPGVFLLNDPVQIKRILVTDHDRFVKGQGLKRARILLGDGLLTSDGELHRTQRRLMQPAFHHGRIAAYASTMVEYAERVNERWRDGSTLDMSHEMMRLTLAIVAKTLFDADVESEAEAAQVGRALTATMKVFPRYLLPFADFLQKLPLPSNRRFQNAKDYLDSTIQAMIQDRRATGADKGDLLSMLLLARDDEEGGHRMTDIQVRDQCMTLFLAGYETTSNALTWTWYLLSENPAVEERLHSEIHAVLGSRSATIQDIPRLKYTEMVFAESMRLFPPAWIIGRRALEDYRINSHTVPRDSLILMSPWVMHRDP